jgi:septum site-determining protein MinC
LENVTIKGTKSGIILVLNPDLPFAGLCDSIADKFKEAASFLGKHDMGLLIRNRRLSDDECDRVISIIEESCDLHIICIMSDDSDYEEYFQDRINALKSVLDQTEVSGLVTSFDGEEAMIYRGNLRSGQDISSDKTIIVMGDVKPGANVTSYGSIYILGELRGNAFAGAGGDHRCVIMALELDPIQIRIAETIAISPDAEKGKKIRIKKKKFLMDDGKGPEVAYIENGHIVKTTYGASFLRQFYKI